MIKNYKNSDEIIKSKQPVAGEWVASDDKDLLQLQFEEKKVLFGNSKRDVAELHVYDLSGNLLASDHDADDWKLIKPEEQPQASEKRLFFNPHKNLRELGFKRGEYKFVYNFIRPLIGEYNAQQSLFIKEIKSNNLELILSPNIVENGNQQIDEQYAKIRKEIDKFFDIKNRVNDIKSCFDSSELPTISNEDNPELFKKLEDIRNILDETIQTKRLNRDNYLFEIVDKTVELRENTFERTINNTLRGFNSEAELFYYFVHEIPNKKSLELREELYYVEANNKDKKLPTGIDNDQNKSDKDYLLIEQKNQELKKTIDKFITDPNFVYLTPKDSRTISDKLSETNNNLKNNTKYNSLVSVFEDYIRQGKLSDLKTKTSLIKEKSIVRRLSKNNEDLINMVNVVINDQQLSIEATETEIIAIGNDDLYTDSSKISTGKNDSVITNKSHEDIDDLREQIRTSQIIIQEVEAIRNIIKNEQISYSRDEIDQILRLAQKDIDTKITNNTVELTNNEFEYIVQPQDDFFEFFELNFSNNVILKIVNIARINDNDIAVKLYESLPNTVTEKSRCWIQKYIRDPYIDNIILVPKVESGLGNTLQGPNFHIETHDLDSKETDFQNWNELLGTNANTSQQIIDNYFSGSGMGDVKLNINYGEFDNFIHFGSAVERVKNFHYKLELIEFYDSRLNVLVTAAQSGSVSTNIKDTVEKKKSVISGFDDFEKYLYFASGSQARYTTESSSVLPWPKPPERILTQPQTWIELYEEWINTNIIWSQGSTETLIPNQLPYEQRLTTDADSITYYQDLLDKAALYDRDNPYALYRTIPDHIRRDSENADYELFVNMIGQHFDIMWTYINQMTSVHSVEEHPNDGIPDDLIFDVAKSMGWNLSNGNYDAKLWEYTLGSDEQLVYQTSGSFMTSKPKDKITKEIWRRQLNNLPYLLKTKGTERSIRALVACYGVPQSILTIREYGGPSEADKRPTYIKDQFDYAANLRNGRWIQSEWAPVNYTGSSYRYPDTITLRFKPHNYTEFDYNAYGKHTLFQVGSGSDTQFYVELEKTGSEEQGNLHFYLSGSAGYLTASVFNANIFDDEFTSVMIQRETSTDNTETNNTYNFYVKKHKWGKLTINASSSINAIGSLSSSYNGTWTTSGSIYVGLSDTPSNTTYFTGSVQELRYWTVPLNESTFDNHVTSVGSYNSNYHTSSYDDLQVRFNLIDNIDISASAYISSSHPNQNNLTFQNGNSKVATFEGTWETNNWFAFDENQYIEGASLGGNNLYSDKIRIESATLKGTLSPTSRQELSAFDTAPLDSKRLGVYFSPQSVINDDIMRQMGYFEIDDYIGSPANLYKDSYPDLKDIAQEYWKKYANKNDIAAYIRLFSVFDFTMFHQIKQLLPARANAITGLVIEPNILERNKIPNRKPEKKELDYDALFNDNEPTASGIFIRYESEIETPEEQLSGETSDYETELQSTQVTMSGTETTHKTEISDIYPDLDGEERNYLSNIDGNIYDLSDQFDVSKTVTTSERTITGSTDQSGSYAGSYFQSFHQAGDVDWVNRAQIVGAPDGIFTRSPITPSQTSKRLNTFAYGFNIPTNAEIQGIQLDVVRFSALGLSGNISDERINLRYFNTNRGDNKADGRIWPGTATNITYGGPTDLWNYPWTPANINESSFGVQIVAKNSCTGFFCAVSENAYVDSLCVTVYWKFPDSDIIKTSTFTDYNYSNQEAAIDFQQDDIVDVTYDRQETTIDWKDFEKPTTYCHDYLLIDSSAPYLSAVKNATTFGPTQVSESFQPGSTPTIATPWIQLDRLLDGAPATNAISSPLKWQWTSTPLILSGYGFNIPNNSEIVGIEVSVWKRQVEITAPGAVRDRFVKLTLTGPTGSAVAIGENRAESAEWPISQTETVYGGANDTWGLTLTGADINNPGFGVYFQARHTNIGEHEARVGKVTVQVYYRVPTVQSTGSSGPWLCDPTESVVYASRDYGVAQTNGYWVHLETDWLSPSSASSFSSSATDWMIPSGTLFPATSSGTDQVTYTSVFSGFGANISETAIGFDAPYNFVYRGAAARLTRYADANTGDYVVDKTITIGTDLTSHTGTNLSSSNENTGNEQNLPNTAGTSGSIAAFGWSNVNNIKDDTANTATATTGVGIAGETKWLVSGDYGFDIPDQASVDGIEVSVRRYAIQIGAGRSSVSGSTIYLTKTSGSTTPFVGTAHTSSNDQQIWSTSLPLTITTETFGSSTDSWGTTWTATDVNNSDFGTYFKCSIDPGISFVAAHVQYVKVKVYYTYLGWQTTQTKVFYGNSNTTWGQNFTATELSSDDFNFKVQATISGSNTANINDVDLKLFYSYYVTGSTAEVQDYIPLGMENHRWNGCKVSSPDINEPSQDTSDKGPVVESTQANPNGLILKRKTATRGNLDLGQAPIKVRS
jgi:hypothetical protein